MTPEQLAGGTEVVIEEWAAVEDLVAHRSRAPGDDLLSALIGASHDGARPSREELVANVMFLFSAGHQQQALVDTEVGAVSIARGDMIHVVLNAVNRDPRRFDVPERLRIDRPRHHPMAFSAGAHLCLGAALARLELAVVLERLATRFPALGLADEELCWRQTVFRGPETLPVLAAQVRGSGAAPTRHGPPRGGGPSGERLALRRW